MKKTSLTTYAFLGLALLVLIYVLSPKQTMGTVSTRCPPGLSYCPEVGCVSDSNMEKCGSFKAKKSFDVTEHFTQPPQPKGSTTCPDGSRTQDGQCLMGWA